MPQPNAPTAYLPTHPPAANWYNGHAQAACLRGMAATRANARRHARLARAKGQLYRAALAHSRARLAMLRLQLLP